MRGFMAMGYPQCAGAIDCFYVYIHEEDTAAYIDMKQHYSIIVQAIVDHQGIFVDTSVGNIGRDHDAHVLRCSNVFECNG